MSETTAAWIYIAVLVWPLACLSYLHARGKVNLLSSITTTKDGQEYVDGKKLAYVGAFAVMATAFAYLAVTDRFTEWYAGLFGALFVGGKYLGDREQRLQKEITQKTAVPA